MPIRILAVLVLAAVTALFGVSDTGHAGEKVTLKIGHVLDTKHPYRIGAEDFAKRLRDLSGGRIDAQVYPSSQLGNEREMAEAIQFGTVEAGGSPARW